MVPMDNYYYVGIMSDRITYTHVKTQVGIICYKY